MLDQPVTGRGRWTVPFDGGASIPGLVDQLECGLEEVHVQAQLYGALRHGLTGHLTRVAVMADEAAQHVAVLLLNPCLIIAAVCSGPGELDAALGAVPDQRLVDERAVVVGVDASDGERQPLPDGFQSSTIRDCSLASRGTASVQPVQTSVATRLWMNDPDSGPPL